MIKTLFLHPLGPAVVLALGGLLLQFFAMLAGEGGNLRLARVFARRQDGRPGRFQAIQVSLALLFVVGAGAALVALRELPAQGTPVPAVAELHWIWQPLTVAGSELSWRLDGWSWLVALLLLLLLGTALLLQDNSATVAPRVSRPGRTLWLGAAALAFVFSSNVVTLASCWILLDAALALRTGATEDGELAGRSWSLLSLAGFLLLLVLLLLGEGSVRSTLARGPFDRIELGILWLAALVRAGVYPFHLWLTGQARQDAGDRVALHLIAPMTGLWLLARVHEVGGPNWLRRPEWAALGALALLGSALAAWATEGRESAWRWVAINRASLVVMAAYMADQAGPSALVWSIVTFGLGTALLAVGEVSRQRWGWSWPAWLGVLTVWGLPGTPGLLARSALVLPVKVPAAWLLFGILVVAETLLVATLWELASREVTTDDAQRRPAVAGRVAPANPVALLGLGGIIVILAVPTVAWGVAPQQLARLLGLPGASHSPTLFQVLLEARRSVWAGLVLSGAFGVVLGLNRKRIFEGMRGWQKGITEMVGLEWLYAAVSSGFALAGSSLKYFAALGEGEGYVGWLMLAALLVWVILRS